MKIKEKSKVRRKEGRKKKGRKEVGRRREGRKEGYTARARRIERFAVARSASGIRGCFYARGVDR